MIKSILAYIRFAAARFTKPLKLLFYTTAFTALMANAASVLLPLLQREALSGVEMSQLNYRAMLLMLLLSLISIACTVFESLALNRLDIRLQNRMQRELLESASRNGSARMDARGAGAYMVSVFGDTEQIASLINTNYFTVALLCVSSVIVIVVATGWSWIFAAVVVPIYLLTLITIILSNKVYAKRFRLGREMVMDINPRALEYLENRLSILGFSNITEYEANLYRDFDRRDEHFGRANAALAFSKSMTDALKTVGLIAFFLLGILQIQAGRLDLPAFVAMLSYYAGVFLPVTAIQNLISGTNRFKMHYDRIKGDLSAAPRTRLPLSDGLKFEDCSFSYANAGGEDERITDLSLAVDRRIGLVGLSGEGKTTLIKLLMGIISPTSGKCMLGSMDTADVSRSVLYSMIRLYGQDMELFNETLEFNVTLNKQPVDERRYDRIVDGYLSDIVACSQYLAGGRYCAMPKNCLRILEELFLLTGGQLEDGSLTKAIAVSLVNGAHMFPSFASLLASRKYYIEERYRELIEDLGLEHLGGRKLGQHGGRVSGGEKNRICLARFLLPVNNGYFIIDEPFTSLDVLAEGQCVEAVKKRLNGIGGIIISHKLNVVRELADEILVLNGGRITERGGHEELIRANGLYAKLYNRFMENKK